jgi:hypothetical protein
MWNTVIWSHLTFECTHFGRLLSIAFDNVSATTVFIVSNQAKDWSNGDNAQPVILGLGAILVGIPEHWDGEPMAKQPGNSP